MEKRGYKLQEFVAHSGNVNCIKMGKKTLRHFVTGGDDEIVNVWSIGKPCITILPNSNNLPTTTIPQSINKVSCTYIHESTTKHDIVPCVQPVTETKTSKNKVGEKTKSSPIQRSVVTHQKSRSSMLVTRRSRTMTEVNPQTIGKDLTVKNDDDLTEFLMLDHDMSLSTLRSRLTKLQGLRHFWDQNDNEDGIHALQKLPDHAVQADVISVMLENTTSLTLDNFSCLVPLLSGLLNSQTERHIDVSLNMLLKLITVFGPVINSTLSTTPSDDNRFENCSKCHIQLQKIHKNLPEVIRWGGLTAKSARELNRMLQQSWSF